jgi:putative acetyltransferase
MDIRIRNETQEDYSVVEELTREAFWNLYIPGCDEHYLVHKMRSHKDFIRELDFVAEADGKIVGSILYTKSYLLDEDNVKTDIITFGPLCVKPDFQRKGIGTKLIAHTRSIIEKMGYPGIFILGDPHNYCKSGFKNGKDYNVADRNGRYPYGLLALIIEKEIFNQGKKYRFFYSDVYENLDKNEIEEFNKRFPEKEKEYQYTQELYSIGCRAYLD